MIIRLALGSSPLARGLPHSDARGLPVSGIIPARAGFTLAQYGEEIEAEDHPRSRGVYFQARSTSCRSRGSSPLARGLHDGAGVDGGVGRIIPARAGFTTSTVRPGATGTDHPRSRGVYCWGSPAYHVAVGSSPLARGLRRLCAPGDPHMRIIPARAGFTSCPWRTSGIASDHPRSRGVYEYDVQRLVDKAGSSPLARGLPALRI